jgi:hypothetical protein
MAQARYAAVTWPTDILSGPMYEDIVRAATIPGGEAVLVEASVPYEPPEDSGRPVWGHRVREATYGRVDRRVDAERFWVPAGSDWLVRAGSNRLRLEHIKDFEVDLGDQELGGAHAPPSRAGLEP